MILGISFDAPEKNKAFKESENFPYRLLSDVDHRVAEAYSAAYPPDSDWASVARRLTFLIGPDGVVRRIYKVKDVAAHADDVLADIASAAAH